MSRPIIPCHKCKTADYVWAQPSNYGEGGRYVRYEAVCERCGQRTQAKVLSDFETEDEAMRAWNWLQRDQNGTL